MQFQSPALVDRLGLAQISFENLDNLQPSTIPEELLPVCKHHSRSCHCMHDSVMHLNDM